MFFFFAFLNRGRRITRHVRWSSGLLFSRPSGRWAASGKAFTCTLVHLWVTGSCPKHRSAQPASTLLSPGKSPRSLPIRASTPTHGRLLHCSAPCQTPLQDNGKDTRAFDYCSGVYSQVLTQIAKSNQFSPIPCCLFRKEHPWYHTCQKDLQATQACTQTFPDTAGGAHFARGDCHSIS